MKWLTMVLTCMFWLCLVPAWAATKIDVANVQELMAQIGSHHELHLAPGTYNLGAVAQTKGMTGIRIYNGGLQINGLYDFKLIGSGAGKTKIISPFVESDVLTFAECSDIQIKDLSVGHRVVPGGCQGDALYIRNSQNVELVRTDLYGCGQYSLTLRYVDNILVRDSNLHDSSYGLLDAFMVRNGKFVNNRFLHTGKVSALNIKGTTTMSFEGCRFSIDPTRKAYSYEKIPLKEYIAKYSLCSKWYNKPAQSIRQLSFINCEFTHVDPLEIELLKSEGVTFREN